VMRLQEMRSSQRSFGIRGVAEEFAAVGCTWVEAGTHGLHYARFWPLGTNVSPLSRPEVLALKSAMVEQGWQLDTNSTCRMALRLAFSDPTVHTRSPGDSGQVLFGMNWPGCAFPIFQPGALGNAKPESESLRTSWATALASRQAVLPPDVVVPAADPGVRLDKVCNELLRVVEIDGVGVRMIEGFPEQGPLRPGDWKQLLRKVRVAAIHGTAVSMDTARVQLCQSQVSRARECFPLIAWERGSIDAIVSNGTNVTFFAQVHAIKVTSVSTDAAIGEVTWRLNRHRLRILLRARAAGRGPLATLEEDVARLVCDFICMEPS